MTGAEANETVGGRLDLFTALTGAVTIDTATVHGGSRSFKCDSAVGNAIAVLVMGSGSASAPTTKYYRTYVNFTAFPASTIPVLMAGAAASLRVTSAGAIQLWGDGTQTLQIGSDGPTLNLGQWYCLEIRATIDTGSTDEAEGRVDGTTFASGTALNLGSDTLSSQVQAGWTAAPGASKVMYIDDLAVNDNTGAAQNTWCGQGRLVLLLPISDAARASLWTGGVGGTTNLFDAVNNTPPIGTAAETDLTQIEHAGGAAGTTDAYDANLTTYATAGMKAGDRFRVAYGVIVTGEDVTTGDKLLSFEGLSNPVIASSGSFNVFAAGGSTAVGTYPTGWKFTTIGFSYDQAVAIGTSPVLRVVRPETATRVASVCFMGLFVEYEDGVPPELMGRPDGLRGQRHVQQVLAQ